MDKIYICAYAGVALREFGLLTVEKLQKYIREDPDSGAIVPAEEIKEVLDFLTTCDFLELYSGGINYQCIYTRYISPKERCQIIKERVVM